MFRKVEINITFCSIQ